MSSLNVKAPGASIEGKKAETPVANAPKTAEDWLLKGDMCSRLGNKAKIEEAVEAYRKAAKLDSKNEKAFAGLGKALFMLDDYKGAEKALAKAYQLDPSNSNGRELAKARIMLGKAEDVRRLFKQIGADPNWAVAQAVAELQRDGKRVPAEIS